MWQSYSWAEPKTGLRDWLLSRDTAGTVIDVSLWAFANEWKTSCLEPLANALFLFQSNYFHLLNTMWECLSSHQPLFPPSRNRFQFGAGAWWPPLLTVGLEPVGSLQSRSQAQHSRPRSGQAISEVETALLPGTAPPFVYTHTHIGHMDAHACQRSADVCGSLWMLDFDSLRGWIPDCDLQIRGGITMFFFSEHRDPQYKQYPFKGTLATTLNPRWQKWNWQSRRQMSIVTLMPTCSTRNHAHKA